VKCELCKTNTATVHFKQVSDGVARELFVCEACAARNGFEIQSPTSLTDFLFGVGFEAAEPQPQGETGKACPVCGLTRRDFDKTSRLGCPACYDAFEAELRPILAEMQDGSRHCGKVPAFARVSAEAAALQEALDKAVARQDFEEAAVLRDRLRTLRGEADAPQAPRALKARKRGAAAGKRTGEAHAG
jgi:protein arginine kinase activator